MGAPDGDAEQSSEAGPHVYENFLLYETRARYYLVGYTRDKEAWRVLKISRMEGADLEVRTLDNEQAKHAWENVHCRHGT